MLPDAGYERTDDDVHTGILPGKNARVIFSEDFLYFYLEDDDTDPDNEVIKNKLHKICENSTVKKLKEYEI